MSLIQQLGYENLSLRARAEILLTSAISYSVSIFTPLTKQFPNLLQIDTQNWDFVVSTASIFVAATRLNSVNIDEAEKDALLEVVAESVQKWKTDGIRGFEDCKMLFESEFDRLTLARHESRFIGSDALGIWIVWNILGHQPQSNDECDLVRATGALTTHAFFDWWS